MQGICGRSPIGRAAQAGVEAQLQQSRGVDVLAVLEALIPNPSSVSPLLENVPHPAITRQTSNDARER